jgi:membrane protein implicated in regulation of membrane protease activity
MKEFAVYTGLRLALFTASFAVLWFALSSWLGLFPLLLLALIVSSILSIFVLRAWRDRLAQRIETRATRMTERLEAARKAEDED